MKRAAILAALALAAAAPAAAGADTPAPAVAEQSEREGWPHPITQTERAQLAGAIADDLAAWIGTRPAVVRVRSFTQARAAWTAGGRLTIRLRVYEDGSYRILAALPPPIRQGAR